MRSMVFSVTTLRTLGILILSHGGLALLVSSDLYPILIIVFVFLVEVGRYKYCVSRLSNNTLYE